MERKPERKKRPELVRELLLQAAAEVVAERGVPGLTPDEVARRAKVSKGGLLHHFSSRQALIESMFARMLSALDVAITARLKSDPEKRGAFTRAYVGTVAQQHEDGVDSRLLGAAALSMGLDPHMERLWREWLDGWLDRCGPDERQLEAALLRYAADGLWLWECCNPGSPADERRAVAQKLLELSRSL